MTARTIIVAQAGLAALLALAVPAHAQSERYAPPPRDFDADAEQHSDFWEEALHPNRELYENRVSSAHKLMRSDSTGARRLLESAIELAPERPEAHWGLGVLHRRAGQWGACAESLARAAAAPGEHLSREQDGETLDYALALCLSRIGEYETALVHLRRALGHGQDTASVHWRMGECYLALGRLSEAISALRSARRQRASEPLISFALAVAYDRSEQPAPAREAMTRALGQGRNHARLGAPDHEYAPPEDRYYYLGLAHAHGDEPEAALVYFRHYLSLAGEGPWTRRTRFHIDALAGARLDAERIQVTGTRAVDPARAAAVLQRHSAELQACMAPVPGVLLTVRVTSAGRRDRSRNAPAPGVRATIEHAFGAESDDVARAVGCVEEVVAALPLPRAPAGQTGYSSLSFPLAAR